MENVQNYTNVLYQHSASQLSLFNNPFSSKHIEHLVKCQIKSKDAKNCAATQNFETHLHQQREILKTIVEVNNDTGSLAKQSNIHNQKVLRFNGREASVQEFLHSRRLN